jgi:hypothetical protein
MVQHPSPKSSKLHKKTIFGSGNKGEIREPPNTKKFNNFITKFRRNNTHKKEKEVVMFTFIITVGIRPMSSSHIIYKRI